MTRLPWEPPTVTSDPRTGTDAREAVVTRQAVVAKVLRERHAGCVGECCRRYLDSHAADARAVLAALAAVPAPTDEGRAAQCVAEHWSRPPSRCALREGHVGSHVTASGRYWWTDDDEPAAAVPASAPTGETREGRCPGHVGEKPWWMGNDQYDPCKCNLPSGHEPPCRCEHSDPPDAAPVPAPATDGPPSAPTGEGTTWRAMLADDPGDDPAPVVPSDGSGQR